eukprot:TRINITY_DN32426_c0_g1_i1.p1 TRINITY_DN32426_c0_g1~~TRINITY_DN32426_c0_g1_i1.p1  ORF type:complete len:199 (+),score=62.63 TRINITY_DN32426_c0_g1_i1:53-598(+)
MVRVLFLHGLESGPQGYKARYIRRHFADSLAPAMDTSSLAAAVRGASAGLAQLRPEVVVGSSFGGAVCVELMRIGAWRGPAVLLAPAAALLARRTGVAEVPTLPPSAAAIVVHGSRDSVVPLEDSERLVADAVRDGGRVTLHVADDTHGLRTVLADEGATGGAGTLRDLIDRAAALRGSKL